MGWSSTLRLIPPGNLLLMQSRWSPHVMLIHLSTKSHSFRVAVGSLSLPAGLHLLYWTVTVSCWASSTQSCNRRAAFSPSGWRSREMWQPLVLTSDLQVYSCLTESSACLAPSSLRFQVTLLPASDGENFSEIDLGNVFSLIKWVLLRTLFFPRKHAKPVCLFQVLKLNVFLITFETFSEIVLIVFSSSESWLLILRKNYVEL